MNRTRNSLKFYLLGLALIALLTTLGHALIERVIGQNEVYGSVVNMAGRQRMLSQRIALTAQTPVIESSTETQNKLTALIDEMDKAHMALAYGRHHELLSRTVPDDARLNALYFGSGELNHIMETFLAAARSIVAGSGTEGDIETLLRLSDGPLLAQLDEAVSIFQAMAEESSRRAELASTLLWLATLLMLGLEWFLIFRPQHRFVMNSIQTMAHQKEALAGEQARYELAAEAARFGVWEQPDIMSNRLVMTPTFLNALGYDAEHLPTDRSSFLKLVHPRDFDITRAELFGPPKRNRERTSVDHRLKCGDGSYRWFSTIAEHRASDDGNSYRLVAFTVDIHDRKIAEQIRADFAALVREDEYPDSSRQAG